jgi:hypothetical protein
MTDNEIRQVQALGRINDFGAAHAADFPAASLGGQKFAEVKALVTELDGLGEVQSSASGAARAGTQAKKVARKSLVQKLRAVRDTSKAMETEKPGVSDNFKLPTTNGDEALINAARAFVTTASPFKADFLLREMPANFLDDLGAAIDQFESASNTQNLSKGNRVGVTAGIKSALSRANRLKKELNPIVRNKYRNDPVMLAAWKSASRVEHPPQRAQPPAPPTPTPPTP